MDIEKFWYEVSPYLYALAGILLVWLTTSGLLIFSGVLFLLASSAQFRLRWVHRRKLDKKVSRKAYKQH